MKKLILIILLIFSGLTYSQKDTLSYTKAEIEALFAKVDSLLHQAALLDSLLSKQAKMGADDNYVTDAEKIIIGNTSGVNTGDNATNTQYSGLAASKQDVLVAGANIKNINGSSPLGSGNLAVSSDTTGFWAIVNGLVTDALAQSDTLIGTGATLDSLVLAYWGGTLSGFDSTYIYQILANMTGGDSSQILGKVSSTDYDFGWFNVTGTPAADTIPNNFEFDDVTDATLNAYYSDYIVVAGCDSARFYSASGDTMRVGALGTKTVTPIWIDVGDTLYTFCVASGTNETTTRSIIYSSDGTPVDSFNVTTVAGGATNYVTGNLRFYWHEDSLATGQVGERYTAGAWHDSIVDSTLGANSTFAPYKDADSGVVWYATNYLRGYPVPSDLLYGSGLSFEILVNLTSLTSPNEQNIIGVRYDTPNIQIFQIGVEQGDSIYVYQYDDGSEYAVETNGNPALNNYIHIVGTTDHAGDLHLYFNGVERTDNNGTPAFNFLSTQYLYIGGESNSYNLASGSAVRYIRIYDDVLTPSEVEQNYTWWTEQ